MNKNIKKFLQWLLSHAITVFSCVTIIALGMGAVAYSSTSTTIGENISTGGTLTVSSSSTLATTTISGGDLTVDTNTLFVDSINNRVGIGTTSPSALLSVNAPAGTDPFLIGSSTATRFFVDANGNVGIGTTSPATATLLTVNGRIKASSLYGLTDDAWFGLMSSTSQSKGGGIEMWGRDYNSSTYAGAIYNNIGGYDNIGWFGVRKRTSTSFVDLFRIKNNGNVGIGTIYPSAILHISTSSPSLDIFKITAGSNNILVNSSGNIGIGTTSPALTFDLYGGAMRAFNTASSTCDATTRGSTFYNEANDSFWGCKSSGWVRLDN